MQVWRSAQSLDGLLTPVAMMFEVLGEVQPVEPAPGRLSGRPASVVHDDIDAKEEESDPRSASCPDAATSWRQTFLDTLKAAGQTAQASGFKSVAHLAALLGPYLRQSASSRDLAEAQGLTAALFSFLAGDLPADEAHCLLEMVSEWVSPVTPLPAVVKRLVADCLASDGSALHHARRERLEFDEAAHSGPWLNHSAIAAGVTVARDELAMVAAAWLELGESVGVDRLVLDPAESGSSEGRRPVSAGDWLLAAEQVENLANALAYMGLDATSAVLQLHVFLLTRLGQNGEAGPSALGRRLRLWVALWSEAFRSTAPGDFRKALALSARILDMAGRSAPAMLEDSLEELAHLAVIESRQVGLHGALSDAELSLALPGDGNPKVLAELLAEMPVLSLAYGDHLQAALQGNPLALGEARRLAHSLKGAALTAGVAGLANYAHALEDLLHLLDEDCRGCDPSLGELLRESASLLVVVSDSVSRGAPAPAGFRDVQERIMAAVNERALRKLQPAGLPPQAPLRVAESAAGDAFAAAPDAVVGSSKHQNAPGSAAAAWPDKLARDAEQALDRARLIAQIEHMQDMVAGASSLPVLKDRIGPDLARLKREVLGTPEAREAALPDVLEADRQALSALLPRLNQVLVQAGRLAGKTVNLRLEGGETLVNAVLLQQLADPLSHLCRNAIDHGIEPAEERIRIGKPATGQLRLVCQYAGEALELVLHDDGRGLDLPRIREKAVAMRLVSAAEAEDCTDDQIAQWIFMAGLSTKDQVGILSGRGVGMDVVRQAFDRLRGELMLETEQGQGTSVHMRLPQVSNPSRF